MDAEKSDQKVIFSLSHSESWEDLGEEEADAAGDYAEEHSFDESTEDEEAASVEADISGHVTPKLTVSRPTMKRKHRPRVLFRARRNGRIRILSNDINIKIKIRNAAPKPKRRKMSVMGKVMKVTLFCSMIAMITAFLFAMGWKYRLYQSIIDSDVDVNDSLVELASLY